MTPRKKPVKKAAVKTVRDESYTPLENYCIALNEYYKALRTAGFSVELALGILSDKSAYPDWILPQPINPNHEIPSWDDEDED